MQPEEMDGVLISFNQTLQKNSTQIQEIQSTQQQIFTGLISSLSFLPLTILPLPFLELKEFHQLVKYFKHQSRDADLFPSIQFPLKEVNDLKYFQDIFQDLSVVMKKSSNWKQHEQEIISALSIVNHVSSFPPSRANPSLPPFLPSHRSSSAIGNHQTMSPKTIISDWKLC
jgi:hypothetical protein